MERRKKRIICLILSCFILLLNITIAKAEAIPDVMSGSATIADCVMSYYAMAGCAVANLEWINSLYDSLGSSFGTVYDFAQNGMLTINSDGTWQATTALTDAIENSSAYTSLGLDQVFNVSADEAAAVGGVAASGAGTLAGAIGGLASTGLLTVAAGVTVAYWGGIGIGTIAAHLLGLYDTNIYNGQPITLNNSQITSILTEAKSIGTAYAKNNNTITVVYVVEDGVRLLWIGYINSNKLSLDCYAFSTDLANQTLNYKYFYDYQNGTNSIPASGTCNINNKGVGTVLGGTSFKDAHPMKLFDNQAQYNSYRQGLLNGTYEFPKINSPDLIGENGNLEGQKNNGKIIVPDLKPQIDPGTQAGVPLTLNDWLNFANSAANNNSQTNPLPDNSALFDSLIDAVVRGIPNPNPDPNPNPNPDPYNPPVVTPVPDPDYDPVPDNPDQPDYESEKQKQTEHVPDEVPTGAPWTTDGLLDKFPFCIPKDMIDMVKQFSTGSRQAPYISWRFNPPGTPIDYTFNLDLSDFEDAATLIRMLELAAFVVGLAFATRYIIGAS